MDELNARAKQCKKTAKNLKLLITQLNIFYGLLGIAKLLFNLLYTQVGCVTRILERRMSQEPNHIAEVQNAVDSDMESLAATREQIQEWITQFQPMFSGTKEMLERAKAAKRDAKQRLLEIEEERKNLE